MKTTIENEELKNSSPNPTTASSNPTSALSMRPIRSMVAKKSCRPLRIAEKGMKASRKAGQSNLTK